MEIFTRQFKINSAKYFANLTNKVLIIFSLVLCGSIVANAQSNVGSPTAVAGNATVTLTWVNPGGSPDAIYIVAKATAFTGLAPSGNGSTVVDNLDFTNALSTVFDGGKVVYAGLTSGQTVTNLTNGQNYRFLFFTRKNSSWSSGVEINATPCAPVDIAAPTILAGNANARISWVAPTCGDEVAIVVRPTTSFGATTPTGDGTAYSHNLDFTTGTNSTIDGGKLVYLGATSPQLIIGLTNGTTYNIKVFTRKGTDWSLGVVGTATPCAPVNVAAPTINLGAGTADVVTIAPSCQDEIMIVMSTATISTAPAGDGSAYTGILDFAGAGTAYDGGKVVYRGAAGTASVINIPDGTYNVKVFTRKGISWSSGVNSSITLCTPDDVTALVATPGAGSVTLTWSGPVCGDEVMIVAADVALGATAPSGNGSAYTADPIFTGAGTPFINGKVVYKGLVSGQPVTGLTNGTTYNFRVFTRKLSVWSAGVDISASPCVVTNVTALTAVDDLSNQALISWTAPTCGQEVVVVVKTGSAFTGITPSGNGSAYTGVLNFTGAGTPFDGGKVVYRGSTSGQTVTNLTNGLTYNVAVFTRLGTTWSSGTLTTFTQGPPTISTLFPADGSTTASTNTQLVLTFTENVKVSASAPAGSSDDIVINPGNIHINRSAAVFAGATATVTIPSTLANSQAYDVVVGADFASDLADIDFAGITTTNWTFTTNAGAVVSPSSGGGCVGSYVPIPSIVITEAAINNITGINSGSRTLVLKFDNGGFQFKPGTTGVTANGSGDIASITVNSVTFSTATFTINFDASANDELDVITLIGLKVTSDGSSGATPGHVIKDPTSTVAIEGVPNTTKFLSTISNGGAPAAPTLGAYSTGNGTYCKNANISAVTANAVGSSITWYSDALLTTVVATGNSVLIAGGAGTLGVNSTVVGTKTYYVTQSTGCESPALTVNIVIAPLPTADAGADMLSPSGVCAGNSITLGGSPTLQVPSVPGAYTYAWTSSDGGFVNPGNQPNPVVNAPTPPSPTQYSYSVLITDANGCTATDTKLVDVSQQQTLFLVQPSSTSFGTGAAAQTLVANITGGIFTGIGVVQTGPTTYKFDPKSAYDAGLPLPQTFPISYRVNTGGCEIFYDASAPALNPIATFTLANNVFANLADQYCGSENPTFSGQPSTSIFTLSADLNAYNNVITQVNNWNQSQRFSYMAGASTWNSALLYSAGTNVIYLGEYYTNNALTCCTSPNLLPGIWVRNDSYKVQFNGTIRNYYEGAYGGNPAGPTVVQQGATYVVSGKTFNYYELITNTQYASCPTCNYDYLAFYVDFINPTDVNTFIQVYNSAYYYYPGDVVLYAGNYYQQILTYSSFPYYTNNQQPNLYPTVWKNLGPTNFDTGNYYRAGGRAGFYVLGQYTTINQTPVVGISGVVDGQDICQADVTGTGFDISIKGTPPSGYSLTGSFLINYGTNTANFDDGTISNGIVNVGSNSGQATLKTKNAFTWVKTNTAIWNSGAFYPINSNVIDSGTGIPYRALSANSNTNPATNPAVWQQGALSLHIRYTFDPQTTGSTPSIHCTGFNEIVVILHDTPTVAFTPATLAFASTDFCFNSAPVTLVTDRSSIIPNPMTWSSTSTPSGITPNANGTAQFVPSSANPSGLAQVTRPIDATYTDLFGCQNKISINLKVNPKVTATVTSGQTTFCNEDTPVDVTGISELFTTPASNPGTGSFVIGYTDTAGNPATSAPASGTIYNFNPKALYALTIGSTNNTTQVFKVTYTETLTTNVSCTNSNFINLSVKAPLVMDIVNLANGSPIVCTNDNVNPVANNVVGFRGNYSGAGTFKLDIDNDFSSVNAALNGTISNLGGVGTVDIQNAYNNAPGAATLKTVYLQYSYTDPSCTAAATIFKPLQLSKRPDVTFTAPTPAANTIFCNDGPPVSLKTVETTGIVFSGFGVIDNAGGTGTLTPNNAYNASIAAGGTNNSPQPIIVKAQGTDGNGCKNFITINYTVNKLPDASFTVNGVNATPIVAGVVSPVTQSFCYTDATYSLVQGNVVSSWYVIDYKGTTLPFSKLKGSQAGPQQDTVRFKPKEYFNESVSLGANSSSSILYDVIYSVKDANGCVNTLPPVTFSIAPDIKPDFTGVLDGEVFCANAGANPNIVTQREIIFSPFATVPANKRTFTINGTTVIPGNANGADHYFLNQNYSKAGGTFQLVYTVISGTGNNCVSTQTKNITVLPAPTADFTVTAACVNASNPVVFLPDNTYAANTLQNTALSPVAYTWTFDDQGGATTMTGPTVQHAFTIDNLYNPTLRVEYPVNSGQVCYDQITKTQTIGKYPIPDFSVADICEGDLTKISATYAPAGEQIYDFQWNFGDGNSTATGLSAGTIILGGPNPTTGTYQNPIHKFTYQSTPYNVVLTAKSQPAKGACKTVIQKGVSVLRFLTIDPINSTYKMSTPTADGGKGFFVSEDSSTPTKWNFGLVDPEQGPVPSIPPGGPLTAKAWSNPAYPVNNISYMNSPCFDMSAYQRPLFDIQYWIDTKTQSDGAVVQWSVDGGASWTLLGGVGTGINWYNEQGISGRPGGIGNTLSEGWSQKAQASVVETQDWRDARHSLDVLPGAYLSPIRKKVRFRIAFGSDASVSASTNKGFAFKDVVIEERNRTILLENFTNSTVPGFAANNTAFYNFNSVSPELVKLQYNTALPTADDLNKQNPTDANARTGFYGLTNLSGLIPKGYIDGIISEGNGNFIGAGAPLNPTWVDKDFSLRSLVPSPWKIDITTLPHATPADNNKLAIQVKYTEIHIFGVNGGKPALFVAVVEKNVSTNKYIVRKMLPSASGIPIKLPMALNDNVTVTLDPWEVKNFTNINELAIVAFIQDIETREVTQAGFLDTSGIPAANLPTIITGLEDIFAGTAVYPNPVDHDLTISLGNAAPQSIPVKVFDQVGKVVTRTTISEGEKEKIIHTRDLAAGMYIVQMETGNGTYARTKVIVVHEK